MIESLKRPRAVTSTLALHGGRPVRKTPLPYGAHTVEEADIQAVVEVLRSDRLTTGPLVAKFEAAFAEFVGAQHAVAFSSGTAALHGAVFAAGLGPGDEAITTPLTFCATANCVLYQGATPIFADVDDETLTIDLHEIAQRLTSRTRAILPVDYAGHPADLDALMALAVGRGLVVIEDATHALGARYGGRPVGSIAHMSVFSFHPVKHLTTGEGGMVTTQDPDYARRLRQFRHHGVDTTATPRAEEPWYYEMRALGFNYRLSDIGCALGLSQLTRLPAMLARREEIAARYTEALQGLSGVRLPGTRPNVRHAWHLYPIRLVSPQLETRRAEVIRALRAEGILATVHFIPVHWHPYYQTRLGCHRGTAPVAESAYEELVSLPIFPGMSEDDVGDVIRAVRKVVGHYGG